MSGAVDEHGAAPRSGGAGRYGSPWGLLAGLMLWGALASTPPASGLPSDRALTQFASRTWTTVDGLPQNAVTAVHGSPEGYLWIGTQEGLTRFDGARFTVFHQRNTEAFLDHFISALEVTKDGTLWIGTRRGLLRYAGGSFERYSLDQGLPHEYVRSLAAAEDGGLWIGTYGAGVARFRDGVFEAFGEESGLPAGTVARELLQDSRGRLWVAAQEGLFYLDEGRFKRLESREHALLHPVRALVEGSEGNLWVASESGELLEVREGRVVRVLADLSQSGDPLTALLLDRDQNLWVGTNGSGLIRLRQGHVDRLQPGEGLAHEVVWALYEDREGSLWVGTRGGLTQLTAGRVTSFTEREGLTNDFVRAVMEDSQGVLWLATGGGLFERRRGEIRLSPASALLPTDHVRSLAEGPRGDLWVGTRSGVHRIRGLTVESWGEAEGLPNDNVNALEAERDGKLWIGTSGGLALLDGGALQAVPLNEVGDPIVRALERFQEALWVGTEEGLVRLEGGETRRFTSADGLPNDFIYALHGDADGILWIGTSGGLARLKSGRFESFTVDQGLISNLIFQILEDRKGDLWLSCNRGIFRLARRELEALSLGEASSVRSFWLDESDGMASSECNGGSQPSGWKTLDGRLWFPTIRGVSMVEPESLSYRETPPPVLIETLSVDGVSLGTGSPAVLGPGVRLIEIRYTAPTFRSPHKVRFRYRLQGFSDHWTEAGSRREAFFTGLKPGTFLFQVEAARGDDRWTSAPAELKLEVVPFFYQTRWFVVLTALVGALLLWLLLRLRLRTLALREEELVALVKERTAQLESANRKLERLAAVDPLTGIANQRQFRRILEMEWRRAGRSQQPVALLLMDIDFFKNFNDTYGHLAGDSCLVKVAKAMRETLERAGDTVARYGGEEFAAVLPRTDLKAALILGERVRRAVEALGVEHRASSVSPHVTVSVGVAAATPTLQSPTSAMDSLIAEADQALYRAKGEGRNQVR
ncbi:MAG: diguanylate cyclase [Acidobacteria bacterium]|nr:diguanylate cyclase [Acidobacteriota bacterium]